MPVVNVLGMAKSLVSVTVVDPDPVARRGALGLVVAAAVVDATAVEVLREVEVMQPLLPQAAPFVQQPPPREEGHDWKPEEHVVATVPVVTVTGGRVTVVVEVPTETPGDIVSYAPLG